MKVIIPLAGYGKRMRPHTWSRPKPLLTVAGNTILGHLLNLMSDITTEEVIFVVGYKGNEIAAWVRRHYPHLRTHFVTQEELLGQAHAIWLCRDYIDKGELLIAFGDGVVSADYSSIPEPKLDGVCLVQEVEDPRKFGVVAVDEKGLIQAFIEKPTEMTHKLAIAGIYWFRNGRLLTQALDQLLEGAPQTNGEYYLADAYQLLLQQGAKLGTKPTHYWLDAGNPENVLQTNARLLGMGGYSSTDAIERSYAEDFTVMPPVFIHETAQVERCIVGPYVSIGPEAVIRDSVIRNSIIEAAATIDTCILTDSLIGHRSHLSGQALSFSIGDDSTVIVK